MDNPDTQATQGSR